MTNLSERALSIAVVIPCHNEALTIHAVVMGFRDALPEARIYVFDNNSTDSTAKEATKAGARVFREKRQGKGNVVRRMFADIEADIYLMADGDGTYDPKDAPSLVSALITERCDMVVGTRRNIRQDAGRAGHAFGNNLFNWIYHKLFGDDFSDIFSGYRVFSRRFVKSFPAISSGFEIETEMSVHASQLMMPVLEMELDYGKRLEGSHSKLNSIRDGFRILLMIVMLMKETRPLAFYGNIAFMVFCLAVGFMLPVIATWLETGLVPRFPTAILSTGTMVISFLLGATGLILDSLSRSRLEYKRMLYLANPGIGGQ